MIQFLSDIGFGTNVNITIKAWENMNRELVMDLTRYKMWFKDYHPTMNDNILVNILYHFMPNQKDDLSHFMEVVDNEINQICGEFEIYSETEGGVVTNLFPNTDVVITLNKNFQPFIKWQERCPLKVTRLDESKIEFFDVNKEQLSNSLVFVELSLMELYIMYREYHLDRLKKGLPSDKFQFINKYVMVNSFESIINNMIFNNKMERTFEAPERNTIPSIFKKYKDKEFNKIVSEEHERIFNRSMLFNDSIRMMKLIRTNVLEFNRMDLYQTKHVESINSIRILPILNFLLQTSEDNINKNRNTFIQMRLLYKRLMSGKSINMELITEYDKELIVKIIEEGE